MDNTYDFYRDKFNDIQRHAYVFLNQVPLIEEEQAQIIRKYSLGTDFVSINSVQDYNKDWLIKGYVKADIREVEGPASGIKGKFLDANTFLKETMVQLPKILFELGDDELKKRIYCSCMEIAAERINERIASLRMQKIQIEAEIEKYVTLLKEYPCDKEEEA
ncbi:MAG: hypothetical protein E7292_09120 [Lachnospiraceae bacterium]|nr:hypothetical protein [Lachnospiraceae bacterium]